MPPLKEQIVELLGLPESGKDAPSLARIEDILTEGYARALALEAECWRIEKRVAELARAGGETETLGRELASLSERHTRADRELLRLRALLASLHDRARAARAAA
jgi:phage shock protein A